MGGAGAGGNRVTRHRGRDGVGWRKTGTTHLRREREGWEVKVEMCVCERKRWAFFFFFSQLVSRF